jgi:DNA repair exonuclease SbcCD ATPase subunit
MWLGKVNKIMSSVAKDLRSAIIEACEELHDTKNVTIQIGVDGDQIILAAMDENDDELESVPFDGDASDCLLSLGSQVSQEIESKVEEIRNKFEDQFNSEVGELREHLESINLDEWKGGLEDLKDMIDEAVKTLDRKSEDFDSVEDLEAHAEAIKSASEEFEKHIAEMKAKQKESQASNTEMPANAFGSSGNLN